MIQRDASLARTATTSAISVGCPRRLKADIAANSYEKALQFHRLTGFAAATGNAYQDVVDTTTLLKAMRTK